MKSDNEMNDNDEFGSKNLIYQKQYYEELHTSPVNYLISLSLYLSISLPGWLSVCLTAWLSSI